MDAEMPLQGEVAQDQAPAAPPRGFFSATAIRVLTINTVFGLLIGVALYAASERDALFRLMGFSGAGDISGAGQSAQAKDPSTTKAAALAGSANLPPNDPVLRFAETRIGQLLFTSYRSDNCQRVLFDNRTGASFDVAGVFCGQSAKQIAETESPKRLDSVRASFQR